MVIRGVGLTALQRKLLRDLREMRAQALAIAAVVAAGVAMFVMYLSNFDSLQRTLERYYAEQRLADVFAGVVRAPASLEQRIARIGGVDVVETRVVADVPLEVPGLLEPASARLVSVPGRTRPRLNGVFLRTGRWVDPARPDEVLASELFCDAHGLDVGARVDAVINGRRRTLTIVGIALSPEFTYAIRPGDIFPDNRRFGIFWMEQRGLAAAFDMAGGFNDVSLALAPPASEEAVIAELDRLLEPYGGRGAIPRRLQLSAWTLDNELTQLRTFGTITPLVFLGVAAFVLNVALARELALQRQQIAALKALGYSSRELAWHYVEWALIIAAAGALAGIAAGGWMGSGMIGMYNDFFRFPRLEYRLSWSVALGAAGVSLLVAALGAVSAVRRAVRIPPAEAMRPESPPRYRPGVFETPAVRRRLSNTARMILRTLARRPGRAASSITGMGFAGAVLFIGFGFLDSMNVLMRQQFSDVMRFDVSVALREPRAGDVLGALRHLPGVIDIEATRTVAVRLRAGHRSRTLAITGVPPEPRLSRVVDRAGRVWPIPPEGLVISRMLGEILDVRAGDTVTAEVLDVWRPVRDVRIAALVDDSAGLQAYMAIDGLRRLLREGGTISGASMTVDEARVPDLYAAVKASPGIAGVGVRAVALRSFRETMAEHMNLVIFLNVFFAAVIAFGVVYNAARVSLSERSRELASLRVLGFTRGEISGVLLGELGLLTVMSLPFGILIGWLLAQLIMVIFVNEVYRISFVFTRQTVAWTWLTVLAASAFSALVVRRRLDRLDLVSVLKTRE